MLHGPICTVFLGVPFEHLFGFWSRDQNVRRNFPLSSVSGELGVVDQVTIGNMSKLAFAVGFVRKPSLPPP